jgi:hypothetical protein
MADKPEVGFQFGVEGDQALLSTIQALRNELKNLHSQQQQTASSAEVLSRAWSGLVQLAAALKIAEFAKDVFDTAVNLGKLSQITGVTTETLSVYYKAATDVGVAHQTVDKGLGQLVRSFVLLQAGNSKAAQGFALLHLSAKDFIGLSTDEKVRKVTEAFAAMKDGPEKAAAATALFSKAGRELIPVLDQLGKEGFLEVQQQAERLGLIFDHTMVEAAARAKASLEDLKGVAEGATAQFETGLIPALDDAARAMVASTTGGGNAFKTLGEYAGNVLKVIVTILSQVGIEIGALASTIVEWISFEFESLKNKAVAAFDVLKLASHGDFSAAWRNMGIAARDSEREQKDASDRISAVWKSAAEQQQKSLDTLWKGAGRQPPKVKPTGDPGDITGTGVKGSLDRTEASGLKQEAQDALTLQRDIAKQKQEQDKRDYDQGLLSLEDYFNRRRDAIKAAADAEQQALRVEKAGLQELLTKAEGKGGKTPQQQLANQQEVLRLKQQIAHVDAQATDEQVKQDTELAKIEDERAKEKQAHQLKELEAQKKLADLEGDRVKSALLANQIEDLQLRKELEQIGKTKAEIDSFLAQYSQARAVRSGGEVAKQDFSGELSSFDARKAAIEEQASAGPLSGGIQQYQAERELKALYEQEIPLLQAKIDKLRQQAQLAQAGSDLQKQLVKEADDEAAKVAKLRTEMQKLTAQWKTEMTSAVHQVSQEVTHGFNGWIQGQESFGKAAQKVWNNILMTAITSIENIAAKWIEQHIIMAAVSKAMKLVGLGGGDDGQTEKKAAQATGSIQIDAATAAADVFAQAISQIPFPANLAAAPALAAATEAEVMAFQAQATAGGAAAAAGGGGFAAGGYVRKRFDGGGFIRGAGSSTSDSIPASLSDREYVVSAKGVESVGVETLDMINRGALKGAFLPPIRQPAPYSAHGMRAYSSGGIVKSFASPGSGGGSPQIHNHNTIESHSIDSKDFREHIDDHMDHIADGLKARMRNFRF